MSNSPEGVKHMEVQTYHASRALIGRILATTAMIELILTGPGLTGKLQGFNEKEFP